MTKAPGCGGATNGVPGATVWYWVAPTSMPSYPFAPPAKVQGTAAALSFSSRKRTCSLSNVGSPTIFVSTLYSKYKSFKLILDVFIVGQFPLDLS